MLRLKQVIFNQMAIKQIDEPMLFCTIYGAPALTIFFKDVPLLEFLVEWIQYDENQEREADGDQNEIENRNLRRLYYQLACHETGRAMP